MFPSRRHDARGAVVCLQSSVCSRVTASTADHVGLLVSAWVPSRAAWTVRSLEGVRPREAVARRIPVQPVPHLSSLSLVIRGARLVAAATRRVSIHIVMEPRLTVCKLPLVPLLMALDAAQLSQAPHPRRRAL